MFEMEQWCKDHDITLTEDQIICHLYLKGKRLRFLVDYGYENVIKVADEVFDRECNKVRK